MGVKASALKWATTAFRRIAGRTIQQYVEDARRDAVAMQQLATLLPEYHAWTKPALRPQSVVTILNDILINDRRVIVELGGGISTYYIARLLQQLGGRLYTVEHDAGWADQLERDLEQQGGLDGVTVIRAPLMESTFSGRLQQWYDQSAIAEVLGDQTVDLLLIDGPPSQQDDRAIRYGALPCFIDRLSDRYMIALDDARRSGERKVVDRWEQEYGLSFKTQGDLAMCIRGQAYVPYP
jgi:predicted O-methyltransferase YrrM